MSKIFFPIFDIRDLDQEYYEYKPLVKKMLKHFELSINNNEYYKDLNDKNLVKRKIVLDYYLHILKNKDDTSFVEAFKGILSKNKYISGKVPSYSNGSNKLLNKKRLVKF